MQTVEMDPLQAQLGELTTEVMRNTVEIQKLKENPASGWVLIKEETEDNVNITNTTLDQSYKTINLPQDFLFGKNDLIIAHVIFENEDPNPKIHETMSLFANYPGSLTGIQNSQIAITFYTDSSNNDKQTNSGNGIWVNKMNLTNNTVTCSSKYASTYGVAKGKVTYKIYKLAIPDRG